MGREDWYRSRTWSEEDRAAFYARLKRSRGAFHKAQYLRIQAVYLAEAGNHGAALDLLTELFRDCPDPSQLAQAALQRATSLLAIGRVDEAIDEYRHSLQTQRAHPGWKTGGHLEFAWLIAVRGMSNLYDEAIAVLDEFSGRVSLAFPQHRYMHACARAIIADSRGDIKAAREFATKALDAASAEHSGFRYHPQLGLVSADAEMRRRLEVIARA
ncbi:MAG: hypothetical protein ABSG31_13220 [Tepidisphaeraceae bacterium]|jgi:tetratricopeptide (TPR) repeat protein